MTAPSTRQKGLREALAAIGAVTREFNARGRFPFDSRSLGRSQLDLLFTLSHGGSADSSADASASGAHGGSPGGGVGVGALAAALGITSGAITQLVDGLRARGLVTSEVNPGDRRARIIRLTDVAAHEVDVFQQDYVDTLAPRFDALTTDEVLELARLLGKVVDRGAAPAADPDLAAGSGADSTAHPAAGPAADPAADPADDPAADHRSDHTIVS